MNPTHLRASRYRCFDDLDLDLPTGCVAILGQNGAGKSSIVNAIDLAIFGPQSRSLADALSDTAPDDDLLLELELEHSGVTYKVRRTFSPRGRGKTTLDFERDAAAGAAASLWEPLTRASARETQELIEQTLGLSRETFRASAFLAQGDGAAFTEAQPRDRKRILAEVLGLDRWNVLLALARADLRAAEQSLALVKAKIETAETEVAERPGLALLLDQAKANEQTARASLDECSAQLAKARERLSALREAAGLREAAERALASADREAANLRERIVGLKRQIAQADERLAERGELEALAEGLPGLERERDALDRQTQDFAERRRLGGERESLYARQIRLDEQVNALRRKILAAQDSTKQSDCDRCGRPLADEFAVRAAESYQTEIDTLIAGKDGRDETEAALRLNARLMDALPIDAPDADRVRQVAELIRLGQNAQTKLAALAEVEAGRVAAQDELEKVRAELPERETAVSAARAELDALGPHDPDAYENAKMALADVERRESNAQINLDALGKQIARLDERLARLDKIAAETKTLAADRDRLQADLDVLAQLERAFSPNGIPALILENSALPYIEVEAQKILARLGRKTAGARVEMRTQRALKSGEGMADALDIVLTTEQGGEREYQNWSGGEKTRINIALRAALAKLLASRNGADCGIFVIDEPDGLDSDGKAALIEILRDMQQEGISRVYLISHDAELRDSFDETITVVADSETTSHVEGVAMAEVAA